MSKLMSFSNLPLGTRFRYPGSDRVYTILTTHRKHSDSELLSGTIAAWEPDMLAKVAEKFDPTKPHAGKWHGQGVFSHTPIELGGDCPDLVEAID